MVAAVRRNSQTQRSIQIQSRKTVLMVLSALSIFTLMATLLFSDAFTQKNAITNSKGANTKDNIKLKMTEVSGETILSGLRATEKRVFCFGDSLTAGTSPPGHELYPYALNLEDALEFQDAEATKVQFRGFPGWTSSLLRTDAGLDSILTRAAALRTEEHIDQHDPDLEEEPPPPFDVVIILAGTNDMAHEPDAQVIYDSIKGIHEMVLAKGCPTIALGIPPSGWQSQSEAAHLLAASVNEKLASWAASNTSSIFLPFPIETFDRSTGFWSTDGLHLSKSGYKFVGTSLAPIVAEILWKNDE